MKEIIKKHWKIILCIVLIVLIVFGIPAIINGLFKVQAPCECLVAEWTASDALNYYGTIMGSFATIAGVFLSIQHAQKNYREDARNRIRPYFAVTKAHQKRSYDPFDKINKTINQESVVSIQETSQNKNIGSDYSEYRPNEVYAVITKDKIFYRGSLSEKQSKTLRQGGWMWEDTKGRHQLSTKPLLSIPLYIDNIGNGAAVCLTAGIINAKNTSEKGDGAIIYTIRPKESFYFHIFSEEELQDIHGDYYVKLIYEDIQGTRYVQSYPLSIYNEGEHDKYQYSMELFGKQTIVMEEKLDEKTSHGNPGSDRPKH